MEKSCRSCAKPKPHSDFHKLSTAPDGLQGRCKACACAATREWNVKNRERSAQTHAEYFKKNKAKLVEASRQWRTKNPEVSLEHGRKYRSQNAEKEIVRAKNYRDAHKVEALEYRRKYREKNRGLVNLWDANRRAAEIRAIPKWANAFFISEAFDLAKRREKATRFKWHVDHIVPLQSELVCGLHVEHNLQVIPASMNMSKSNRVWPDMP